MKTILYLSGTLILTFWVTSLVGSAIVWTDESWLVSLLWLAGFGILFWNVSHLFLVSILRPFLKTPVLKETFVKRIPKTALVYPIRNETHGLLERMDYSFKGNFLNGLDLWILSDSDPDFEPEEYVLLKKLQEKYGSSRVFYRRRNKPVERKQGNIKDFIHAHPEYRYLYITDADSMVPRGTILKLIRKAEHPANHDVAIFQAFVKIAHAKTWYAYFEKIGTDFAQRFNFIFYQAWFGRSISFGHHHLARRESLLEVHLPKGLLSHDNWDTALLDQMGERVCFCPDVTAYDEAPSNYLEAKTRGSRWAQGTLQGTSLIRLPKISPTSRFLAFYGVYLYLADLVFFFWVVLGLLSHSGLAGELIHYEADSIWMDAVSNLTLKWTLIASLTVIYCHKLVIVRSVKDFKNYLFEIIFSTLVTLNNFFYVPLSIALIPFKKLKWQPMNKNPFEKLTLTATVKNLAAGTLLGGLGIYFLTHETPYFIWQITPILLSLILSIPLVYWTSKRIPGKWIQWI